MSQKKHITFATVLIMLLLSMLGACSTGIEGTKTIKMSKTERQETAPTEEDLLAARFRSESLPDWRIGKPFLIADSKAGMLLEFPAGFNPDVDSIRGKTIYFRNIDSRITPGGQEIVTLHFDSDLGTVNYNSRLTKDKALQLTGLDIPMLIDLDMVSQTDSLLRNRRVWTKSTLWYDSEMKYMKGEKYVPVTITGTRPGNGVFPLLVDFTDNSGRTASMYLNVAGSKGNGTESRTFPTLFALSDPKLRYPGILPEVWEAICREQVAEGMTKDECRLSLGNPSDVNAGDNWNSVIEIWTYKDGTYLQFRDGLLIKYRH